MKINFKSIFSNYLFNLQNIKRKLQHKDISENEAHFLLYQNLDWFHYIKHYFLNPYKEIRNKKTLNNKQFLLPLEQRCPGCEDGKPFKVIKYRGFEIPVYDDSYGQQDFAIVLGEEISGGSYNIQSINEFTDMLDIKLQNMFLKDEYDMHAEYNKTEYEK